MFIIIPEEAPKEFEIIKCQSAIFHQKSWFFCKNVKVFTNLSQIQVRRYMSGYKYKMMAAFNHNNTDYVLDNIEYIKIQD
jgi:hypothetical protein